MQSLRKIELGLLGWKLQSVRFQGVRGKQCDGDGVEGVGEVDVEEVEGVREMNSEDVWGKGFNIVVVVMADSANYPRESGTTWWLTRP